MRGGAGTRIGPAAASATTLAVLLDDLDSEDLAELLEDGSSSKNSNAGFSRFSGADRGDLLGHEKLEVVALL